MENKEFTPKPSQYVLVMFPYPSSRGLHMGHFYNYAIMDSYCRWKRRMGIEVFQPFGYDSFGLPAENYALKIGGDVKEITYQNIANYRKQMDKMNTVFQEMLITSDESYQKWTKWIFTKLYEKGLAYKKDGNVNWCSSCKTVIANEQVKNNKCERCDTEVEDKIMNQWYFKITDYKDRLIKGLETVEYPESTKKQQIYWLNNLRDWCVSRQRKWGCPIPIEGESDTMDTFVDSSFYYLRYLDPTNENELFSKEKYKQVDIYVGGSEHACMHLIYARFIHYFLYDIGIVPVEEPFKKVFHQGFIKKDGEKMSKSKGNVVNPDDYDSQVLRQYMMFIGPYKDGGEWSDGAINGVDKFIKRMYRWFEEAGEENIETEIKELENKISNNIEKFKFNIIVSDFMKFYNSFKNKKLTSQNIKTLREMFETLFPVSNIKVEFENEL